jgi:hypothetical protein
LFPLDPVINGLFCTFSSLLTRAMFSAAGESDFELILLFPLDSFLNGLFCTNFLPSTSSMFSATFLFCSFCSNVDSDGGHASFGCAFDLVFCKSDTRCERGTICCDCECNSICCEFDLVFCKSDALRDRRSCAPPS